MFLIKNLNYDTDQRCSLMLNNLTLWNEQGPITSYETKVQVQVDFQVLF